MPLLITYQGRPIKRRKRLGKHLKLTFYASTQEQPGDQLLVTQEQWQQHGREAYMARTAMPDVRTLNT